MKEIFILAAHMDWMYLGDRSLDLINIHEGVDCYIQLEIPSITFFVVFVFVVQAGVSLELKRTDNCE